MCMNGFLAFKRVHEFALGIAADTPQRSEEYERIARPEGRNAYNLYLPHRGVAGALQGRGERPKKITLIVFLFCLVISCNKADKIEKEIAGIEVNLAVKRFDKAFAGSTPDKLPELKNEFPYLFPEQFPDSVWVNRMNDTLQHELSAEVLRFFPDFEAEKTELESLFRHIKYYFPDFKTPEIVTITSDVDYNNKIIYADSLLLVSLDTYLGETHHFYEGIQQYLKKNFNKTQLVVDAASEITRNRIAAPRNRTFLAQMLYYGKALYVKELLLPATTDAEKIGYTEDEWRWAVANEAEVWRYFVERELLFSTDSKLPERFIFNAPFSKFYLGFDNESPGKLGQYIGWEIVRAYMKNNSVSLQQLLSAPAEKIFNESQFKPQK